MKVGKIEAKGGGNSMGEPWKRAIISGKRPPMREEGGGYDIARKEEKPPCA